MKRILVVLLCLPVFGLVRAQALNQKIDQPFSKVISYNVLVDSIPPDSSGMGDLSTIALAQKMVPGWNVGNSLDAIGGETAWGNPKITQQLMDSVRAAGFHAVRIPVAWSKFTDTATYTIDTNFMNRVEQVVNYVLNDSMYAIVNIHWDGGWMQPTYASQNYVDNRLSIMWHQIAVHFRDYGDHLLFAGTNEVMVNGDYGAPTKEYYTVQNGFNQIFVNTVRSTGGHNAYRYLVVQGFNTNIGYTYSFFARPKDVTPNRLIAEVHYYDPYDFTINSGSSVTQWGKYAIDPSKTETWANESYADGQFQKMTTRFIDSNMAVIVGEYGAMARISSNDSINAENARYREYYMAYITKSMEKHDLVPFYWDNGGTGNNGMGLFNRYTGAPVYPKIIQAIVDTSFTVVFPPVNTGGGGTNSIKQTNTDVVKLFPNPVSNVFHLELNVKQVNFCGLYSDDGQLIKTLSVSPGINTYNVSNLNAGIYIVRLTTSNGIVMRKIIKN